MKDESLGFYGIFIPALVLFFGLDLLRHHDDLSLVFSWINFSANVAFCAFIAVGWKAFECLRNLYQVYVNYLIKKTEALGKGDSK